MDLSATTWAFVVGGSRGIGAACAETLASPDRAVVLTYRNDTQAAERVCGRVKRRGAPWVRPVALDLTDPKSAEQTVSTLLDELGPPDCLVHAGGELLRASIAETGVDNFQHALTVNCVGAYAISRVVGLAMRDAGRGSIVFLSSVIGPRGARERVAYGASKSALNGMARAMATEFAPTVRVNVVMPGTVDTDMTAGLRSDPQAKQQLLERTPLGRLATPHDVAEVVGMLVDRATYVTGVTWAVDGGLLARLATPSGDPSAPLSP
jgi:2-deoxy-D-gluconate 3-dehydrogenase